MQQNVVGHLDPFFLQTAAEVGRLIGHAFSTANQFNLAISGTGSSGMEAAVANFTEPGTKFALLSNGFFAERIGEMARRQGGEVVKLAKEWGRPYDSQEAREFIKRERPQVVAFVQAETSTGMFNHAKPICEAAREVGALTIADCVTSLGAMPVSVDENGIDIAYSCSQDASAFVVSRFAAARRVLHRPQIPPHRVGDAILRLARSPGSSGRGGSGRAVGAASPEPSGVRRGH
jgi:alanine-glyoxylate transaminase/serine-glyoxylate transaminase/serine-pyruvate transaminase